MVGGFERRVSSFGENQSNSLIALQGLLDAKEQARISRIRRAWDFYEGYHWEDIPVLDSSQVTYNFCRTFVNKFVSFELGKGFTFSVHSSMRGVKEKSGGESGDSEQKAPTVTADGRTLFEFLEDVWEDNDQYVFGIEMGQMKSVTGETWVQVGYNTKEELDERDLDLYNEHPEGRLFIHIIPTAAAFPEFDPHVRGLLTKFKVMYVYEAFRETGILGRRKKVTAVFKQEWTKDTVTTDDGQGNIETLPNRYGVIPFVQIKNLSSANYNGGVSDLDDLIPMNFEYNQQKSRISDILAYHAAPVTLVYGAKIGNLEKGANKMWGGLSKDARVENLELKGDMSSSASYIADLKRSMCEVSGIPETVLGGAAAVSNTSGVALQYLNLPLIERTNWKRMNTRGGLEALNKLILVVALSEALVVRPENIPLRDFLWTEVSMPDTLPKDELLQLQALQTKMKMGLKSRKGAAEELGEENIDEVLQEVGRDMKENPVFYGHQQPQINSGVLNGQTPVEEVRKEMTGSNGMDSGQDKPDK